MTNNKEKLTQATIKALQGDLKSDIDTKESCKRKNAIKRTYQSN